MLRNRQPSRWLPRLAALLFPLAPVVIALVITSLLVMALGHSPWQVYTRLFQGAFGTAIKRADTLVVWVSLAISAAGLLITFRAGQWNIGIEGQITLGAIGATWAAQRVWDAPGGLAIPLLLLAGMAAGAGWGALVGLLKIYGGVHEIFGGLGLNFVATSLTIYLISGPWKPPGTSSVAASQLLPTNLWLPTLDGLRASWVSLALAVVTVVSVGLLLRGTVWGLQLKAIGRNMRAAFLLGAPTHRLLLSAYVACGVCAGLVGGVLVIGVRHQLVANISSGYGFSGILVVLLAGFSAALIAPVALFFAAAGIGGIALTLGLQLDSSLSGVLIGLIVLSFELLQGVRQKYIPARPVDADPVA